jgi:hypothetical protein
MIHKDENPGAFATRQGDFMFIRMQYDLNGVKWEASNRKCFMIIKSSIMEAIRGAIPPCDIAKEYLKKVESQFTNSSKMYASTIIKRLMTEKYIFGNGVREHILEMSNMVSKLKPMDMGPKDEFVVHLIMLTIKEAHGDSVNHMKHNNKNYSNSS